MDKLREVHDPRTCREEAKKGGNEITKNGSKRGMTGKKDAEREGKHVDHCVEDAQGYAGNHDPFWPVARRKKEAKIKTERRKRSLGLGKVRRRLASPSHRISGRPGFERDYRT